jgi:RimJ/RimL family protein N-acetyltransferase
MEISRRVAGQGESNFGEMNATSPQILTTRLCLMPFGKEHLTERYVAWLNDPEVVRYSEQRHRRHTLDSCAAYVESFRGTPNHLWAILCVADGRLHVGNANAYVDTHNGLADVGIMIGEKSHWGRGYAKEAWMGICDCLFRQLRVRKVTAGTVAANKGMLGVMESAGMVPDGTRLKHYQMDGHEVDVVHAALFRDDWLARHPKPVFG